MGGTQYYLANKVMNEICFVMHWSIELLVVVSLELSHLHIHSSHYNYLALFITYFHECIKNPNGFFYSVLKKIKARCQSCIWGPKQGSLKLAKHPFPRADLGEHHWQHWDPFLPWYFPLEEAVAADSSVSRCRKYRSIVSEPMWTCSLEGYVVFLFF